MSRAKGVNRNQALSPGAFVRGIEADAGDEDDESVMKEFILDYMLASLPFEY
ncbi:MAG: hypothetical protein HPY55_06300 [Firmicutes bacterium]|nr:hypothetical protein [Bacillota bacterium]